MMTAREICHVERPAPRYAGRRREWTKTTPMSRSGADSYSTRLPDGTCQIADNRSGTLCGADHLLNNMKIRHEDRALTGRYEVAVLGRRSKTRRCDEGAGDLGISPRRALEAVRAREHLSSR